MAVAVVVFGVTCAVLLVVASSPAAACSCTGWSDDEAFEHADVVFVGEVSDVALPAFSGGPEPSVWTFEVSDVYKGSAAGSQTVVSAGSCGIAPPRVGSVVVFATRDPEVSTPRADGAVLYAILCGGTRAIAEPFPTSFGVAHPPAVGTDDVTSNRSPWFYPLAGVLVSGALAAVVVGIGRSRRRRGRPPTL